MTENLSKSAGTAGKVGLATESGVLAAAAGGAVEGGLAGAASGAASYTTLAALGETGGWDWGDFAGSTFGGLGRVAAVVSDVRAVLDANGSAVQASNGSDSVIRVSYANSYDKYGRVLSNYAFAPTVPAGADSLRMLWSDTKYDLGGKVVSTTRNAYGLSFAGIVYRSVTERYTYDRLGRVENIYSNQENSNVPLAHYEYYPTGSVKSVNLGNSLTLAYTYHISGAVKTATVTSAKGNQLYSETLNYEDCGNGECTPQYNGNISRMAHQMASSFYTSNRDVAYAYDAQEC